MGNYYDKLASIDNDHTPLSQQTAVKVTVITLSWTVNQRSVKVTVITLGWAVNQMKMKGQLRKRSCNLLIHLMKKKFAIPLVTFPLNGMMSSRTLATTLRGIG